MTHLLTYCGKLLRFHHMDCWADREQILFFFGAIMLNHTIMLGHTQLTAGPALFTDLTKLQTAEESLWYLITTMTKRACVQKVRVLEQVPAGMPQQSLPDTEM